MSLRILTLIAILLSIVSGIFLGVLGFQRWSQARLGGADLDALATALRQVQSNYVRPLSDQEVLDGALRGLMQNLDPHSTFLDARASDQLTQEATGRFGGVGIELGFADEHFTVVTPIDGTPADRGGIQSGDRLLAVDAQPLRKLRLPDVVALMRGTPGTEVNLRVERDRQVKELVLTRETIAIDSVTARWQAPNIAYVRITQFQMDTGPEFTKVLKRLQAEPAGGDIEGLILDLRNNPGGVLQSSVAVSDALLTDGLIVRTEGRLPSSHSRYAASGADLLNGAPVVVLINSGSASAAEIVAGALKDHDRAVLMGERSYGKGSVQSLLPLGGNRAVKLTTAYYLTPKGGSIHRRGIAPDVPFANDGSYDDYSTALLAAAVTRLQQPERDSSPAFAQKPSEP